MQLGHKYRVYIFVYLQANEATRDDDGLQLLCLFRGLAELTVISRFGLLVLIVTLAFRREYNSMLLLGPAVSEPVTTSIRATQIGAFIECESLILDLNTLMRALNDK